jgi:transposase
LEEKKADNGTVINRYGEPDTIEQAFRISKSDLQTRPVFHYREEPIRLHILICFMALVISMHVEPSTGKSIKKFITEAKKITEARMLNLITDKEIRIRTSLSKEMELFLTKLNLSH